MDFEVILLEYLSVIKYKWREKLKYLHLYFLNLTEGEGAVALTIEVGTVAFTIFFKTRLKKPPSLSRNSCIYDFFKARLKKTSSLQGSAKG